MAVKRSVRLAIRLAVCLAICLGSMAGAALEAQPGPIVLTLSPTHPTTADHVLVHAAVTSSNALSFLRVDRSGNLFTVVFGAIQLSPQPPTSTYTADFDLGLLPVGSYQVAVGGTFASFDVTVPEVVPTTALVLDGGRFSVTLLRGATVESPLLVTGGEPATAVRLSDDSGYFWFFDSGNVEVTVKILDGTAVNGHFWLFAATMTDQPFVLRVIDTQGFCGISPCPPKLYVNTAGKNQNFIDVQAFAKALDPS
jgi:hypothetical protein